jgi:hypothetical protein
LRPAPRRLFGVVAEPAAGRDELALLVIGLVQREVQRRLTREEEGLSDVADLLRRRVAPSAYRDILLE